VSFQTRILDLGCALHESISVNLKFNSLVCAVLEATPILVDTSIKSNGRGSLGDGIRSSILIDMEFEISEILPQFEFNLLSHLFIVLNISIFWHILVFFLHYYGWSMGLKNVIRSLDLGFMNDLFQKLLRGFGPRIHLVVNIIFRILILQFFLIVIILDVILSIL